jgi:hypothetical protein
LGSAALGLVACSDDDAAEPVVMDSADDDEPADDDVSGDDDPADDDAEPPSDDDEISDDDADDDSSMSFETDAGTIEVIFSGEGETCGEETCPNGTLLDDGEELFMLEGCCADEDAETCGLDMTAFGILIGLRSPGCEPLGLPGSPDENCPPSEPLQAAIESVNGVVLPGCCQEAGQCGYYASFEGLGFGCLSPTRFGGEEGDSCEYAP